MKLLLAALLGCTALAANPHIFLIIADDYGWHNIGYHNPEIKSPNLDALAADGIKLNRHYVFKYCSPTRSSMLTGRLPLHVNQNNECNDELSLSGPDIRMAFLPQKMKKAGYRTAMTGKWHLGARSAANLPINRGFDTHLGFLKGGQDHLSQKDGSESMGMITDIWSNHTPAYGRNGTYSTLIYGPEAVRIVEDHPVGEGAPPLFMYLPFQNTHSPYQVPSQYLDPAVKNKGRQIINAMVNVMDEAVGNLTAALKRKDMWKDTLIVFSADNGGITRGANCGNNYPLRGQKTSSWEGGVRAVAFMSGGTDLITPELRGTTNNAYIHVCDWYGTLLTLVGVDPTDNYTPPPGTVVAESDGPVPPPVDSIDQWKTLMTANATTAQGARQEVELAFCPQHVGGSDNCAPTKCAPRQEPCWTGPNGTKVLPRNGALIQGQWKLVYGEQFGYGTYTGPTYPNSTDMSVGDDSKQDIAAGIQAWETKATGPNGHIGPNDYSDSAVVHTYNEASGTPYETMDAGCPTGCLFDILADPEERNDLAKDGNATHAAKLASMIDRLMEIGLTQFQTNYTDFPDDSACITEPQMLQKYKGFLGPRCGVTPP